MTLAATTFAAAFTRARYFAGYSYFTRREG
jgi:hypothetical protein